MATQTDRKFERISRGIKRRIASGTLVPGQRLPAEREMARQCKSSRVSVREAYRSLEELGILVVRRGADGGAFVAQPDTAALQKCLSLLLRLGRTSDQELSDARVIEPTIARLAARHAQADDIVRLRHALAREEEAMTRRRPAGLPGARFQRALAACARNRPLMTLVNPLVDLTADALSSLEGRVDFARQTSRSQRAILQAVERHDEEGAYLLQLHHCEFVGRLIAETRAHSLSAAGTASAK